MSEEIKILFVKEYTVLDHNDDIESHYEEGKEYSVSIETALHCMNRGYATDDLTTKTEKPEPEKKTSAKKKQGKKAD